MSALSISAWLRDSGVQVLGLMPRTAHEREISTDQDDGSKYHGYPNLQWARERVGIACHLLRDSSSLDFCASDLLAFLRNAYSLAQTLLRQFAAVPRR
jgi:hypothetical protein